MMRPMKIRTKIALVMVVILVVSSSFTLWRVARTIYQGTSREVVEFRIEETRQARERLVDLVGLACDMLASQHDLAQDKSYLIQVYGPRLENVAAVTDTIMREKLDLAASGAITEAEAQRQAAAAIRQVRFEPSGYVWINDNTLPYPRMIMHPLQPELDGKVLDDPSYNCAMGRTQNLFQAMAEVCRAGGSGYVDYLWTKPLAKGGMASNVLKLSFVKLYTNWNWILGVGIYVDDAEHDAQERAKKVLRSTRFDRGEGYFWISDTNTPVPRSVMHPFMAAEEGTIMDHPKYNVVNGTNIWVALLHACWNPAGAGFVEYRWDKPLADGTFLRLAPKLAYSRLYRPWGWVLGTGVYLDSIDRAVAQKQAQMDEQVAVLIRHVVLGTLGMMLLAVLAALMFAHSVCRPVRRLVTAAREIATGNLDVDLADVHTRDEVGELGQAIQAMTRDLASLVSQVQRSSVQLAASATEIAATSRQQEATTVSLSAATSQVAAAVNEISATTQDLSRTMNEVKQVAQAAETEADRGQAGLAGMDQTLQQFEQAIRNVAARLADITEKTGAIGAVVNTITKVAEKTNLLSLNAAIEAERAGEHGRGFAVVAREIRMLADQTAVATLDIENMVRQMEGAVAAGVAETGHFNRDVRQGLATLAEVGRQLHGIIEQVKTMTPRFRMVSEGMDAQSAGARQISEAMGQLNLTTSQNAEALRQFQAATEMLSRSARDMQSETARFKVKQIPGPGKESP